MRYVFIVLAFGLALTMFLTAANHHAWRDYNLGLTGMWDSKEHVLELFLFISPCVIYLITTAAYYKFVVTYRGEIAGWSFVGFLAASLCCAQLLEADPTDWASHLLWVYVLFLSYAWWDMVMLLWLLPRTKNRSRAAEDDLEIYTITSMINWPTLGTLALMWFYIRHIAALQLGKSVGPYVSGILAFHLVFASCVAMLNIRWRPLVSDEPESDTTAGTPAARSDVEDALNPKA